MKVKLLTLAILVLGIFFFLYITTLVAKESEIDIGPLLQTTYTNYVKTTIAYTTEITFTPTFTVFLPIVMREFPNWAESHSYPTTCAEEDNVNIPIFARQINRFQVVAIHPTYDVGIDNCNADFSGCTSRENQLIDTTDTCDSLYDDGVNVIHGCTMSEWWRPHTMKIVVGNKAGDYHYLVMYRKIAGENSWPQFLVLYEDGNMRLIPHPPVGRSSVCFGSSIIIGPAATAIRPYIDIQEVQVNPSQLTLELTYRNGETAHINLSVNRSQSVASVDINYTANSEIPFTTFRSMYVSDGNADADYIQTSADNLPIMSNWINLEGPWWFFYRNTRSIHNTSAPDIRIDVLD